MYVYLDNISSTTEPFVTKLGMVMHHHGPECHARRLACYLQGHGHSEGSCSLNMIVSTISTELLPPKGGRGCLMSPPCLESQGCHLIPLCYLLSCSSACPVTLSVLSFSACWPFLLNFFLKILQYFSLRDRLFCMAPV